MISSKFKVQSSKLKNEKIYILHGWAYTTDKWQPLIEKLRKEGIEAVMLKIPGLTAPLNEVWNLDNYVGWLKEILDKENDRVILLGHSNGGRIALTFTAKYPEKVKQLILIDSAGIYHNELPIQIKRFVFGNIARVGRKFTNSQTLRKLLYKLTRESDYERANPLLRKTMQNLVRTDISDLFPHIHLPVTIIWGELDEMTSLSDGKIMHQSLKNSTFHVIRGARHSPMFTHVEEVGEIIIKVLSIKY